MPFAIVLDVPAEDATARTELAGGPGFTTLEHEDLGRFGPRPGIELPLLSAYLVTDVDPGRPTLATAVSGRRVARRRRPIEPVVRGAVPAPAEAGAALAYPDRRHPAIAAARASSENGSSRPPASISPDARAYTGLVSTRAPSQSGDRALRSPLEQVGAAFAYLFGSRARGDEHDRSDADVALMPTRMLELRELARLCDHLAVPLGVEEVDVVLLDEANLELRGRVVQEGRLLFSRDEPARVAFEVRTRSEYLDYLPTLREHTRRYLGQVAERGLSRGRP